MLPPISYKQRLGGLRDVEFYRAMLEAGLKPPLPVNGLLASIVIGGHNQQWV